MITQEQYDALNAKIDMYIQTQNALEKDFREVERKVYKLEQAKGTPLNRLGFNLEKIKEFNQERENEMIRYNGDIVGASWLR